MRDCPTWPAWLPPLVAEHAILVWRQAEAAGNVEEADALERITSDPRMEAVWNYLRRRRRDPDKHHVRTHLYYHAAWDVDPNADIPAPDKFPTRSETLQQLAMSQTCGDMVRLSRLYGMPSGPARGPRAHPHLLDPHPWLRSNWLRAVLSQVKAGPAKVRAKHERILRDDVATALNGQIQLEIADTVAGIPAAVVRIIGSKLRRRFGVPMVGQTAIIAGVILNSEVSAEKVQRFLCARWG
jgi:hypothetical protein